MREGIEDHLTSKAEDVKDSEIGKATWTRTDVLLYRTCYGIWN